MKTLAELNKRSVALSKRSRELAKDIHTHMVDIVAHVKAHGDVTAATFLIQNIHSAVRRQAIVNWFCAFGGMNFNKDKEGVEKFTRNKSVPADQIDLKLCEEESPWDYTPEPELKAFDLDKAIAQLIKRAEKRLEDPTEGDKIDADKLELLKSLAA